MLVKVSNHFFRKNAIHINAMYFFYHRTHIPILVQTLTEFLHITNIFNCVQIVTHFVSLWMCVCNKKGALNSILFVDFDSFLIVCLFIGTKKKLHFIHTKVNWVEFIFITGTATQQKVGYDMHSYRSSIKTKKLQRYFLSEMLMIFGEMRLR